MKLNPHNQNLSRIIVLFSLVLATAAQAANGTWNGTTSALWSLAGNWSASPAPGTGDTATFNNAGNAKTTLDLTGGLTIKTILFDTASVAAYTIGSGAVGSQSLILNNGGAITANSAINQNQLFNAAITLGTDATAQSYSITDNSASKSLTFAGGFTGGTGGTAGAKTLNVSAAAGGITLSGAIVNGGASSLRLAFTSVSGNVGITLSGGTGNTYTGGTSVGSNVRVNVSTANSLSGGAITIASGGQVFLNSAGTYANDFTISGNGWAGDSTALGAIRMGNGTVNTINGTVTLAANSSINVDTGKSGVINGKVTGGFALTKSSAGTLTLANAGNDYSGATTVSAGTLLVNSPGVLAAGSAVTVASGATLGGNGTINGTVSVSAGGTLAPGGANTIGTLTLANSGSAALTLNGNAVLCDLPNTGTTCDLIAVTGTLVLNGANFIVLNAPSGAVPAGIYTVMTYAAQTGSGTLTFQNGSTTMGNATLSVNLGNVQVTVGPGGLNIGLDAWKGGVSGVWDGGILNWTRNGTASQAYTAGDSVTFDDTASGNFTVSSSSSVSPASVTFNNSANAYTVSAAIGGTIPVVKLGTSTATLSGNNTYTGSTIVSAGTLKLGAAGALGNGTLNTSGVVVSGSGIFDFGGFAPTYAAPISLNSTANAFDVGAFLNSGASAVSFGGNITLQQQTRFGGSGALLLTGAITGNGVKLIKDSTGLLELQNSGNVTLGAFQANRGTLQVDSGTTLDVTSIDVGTGNSVGAGLTLNGGAVTASSSATPVRFGQGGGSASGTLTLNSGTLTVPFLTKGSLTFNLNFNGGTLKANAASATFLASASSALVKADGAFIDDGGFAITVGQGLTHDAFSSTNASGLDGGLVKSGDGTLTLSGANSYTGPTTVSGGTLKVANASALGFGGLQANATGGTTVNNGFTLDLNGTAVNEPITLNGLGLGNNGALVNSSGTAATIGSGVAGLTIGSATGTGSGYSSVPTITISGTGSGATATASLGLTTSSFTISSGGSGFAVSDIVSVTGGGGSGALFTVASVSSGAITGLNPLNAGTGYTTAPTTLAKVTGAGTGATLTGNATSFTVGGVAMTAAGAGYTGTPSYSFSAGNAVAGTVNRSSVVLASDGSIGGSGNITINAVISESGGTRALTKVGTGTLTLAGANTYTGGTIIQGTGSIIANNASAFGTGTVALKSTQSSTGTTLGISGGVTVANALTMDPTTGREAINGSGTGDNSFTGGLTITGSTANALIIGNNQTSGNFTFSGGISGASYLGSVSLRGTQGGAVGFLNGVVTVASDLQNNGTTDWTVNAVGSSYNSTRFLNTGSIILGADNALAVNAQVYWNNSTAPATWGKLQMNGYNASVAGLNGTQAASGGAYGAVINNGANNVTLTLANMLADLTFAGTIDDGSKKIALVMNSANRKQTLSGVNTYAGATTVSGGTLALGASGSIASSTPITVGAGANFDVSAVSGYTLGATQTLKGNGTVNGAVTVNGTIAAGASVGTLNTDSETWAPGGANIWEMADADGTKGGTGWDWLNITGDLTITATNKVDGVPADGNKFTIKLVSLSGAAAGPAANFHNDVTNTWIIATASGSVNQFIANKFIVDTNGFQNDLAGGTFSVVVIDQSVALAFTPASPGCTATLPPTFRLTDSGPGSSTNVVMTFVNSSGLSSVQALTTNNCIITGVAYDAGGHSTNLGAVVKDVRTSLVGLGSPISGVVTGVVLTATKLLGHESQPAAVNAIVMDYCGRGKSFDPVITTLAVTSGNQVQQRFEGLIAAEHYLHVVNATPGLKWLEVNLNGRVFRLDPLTNGQEVSADLASAMHEGDNNVVILTGHGDVGSSALVMITDTASDGMVSLPEIVTLGMSQTADGLVLSWPDTLAGWQLQSSAAAGAGWTDVADAPVSVNGQLTVKVSAASGAQFYHLANPAPTAISADAATVKASDTGISNLNPQSSTSTQRTYDGLLW